MAEKRITKRERFEQILDLVSDNPELVEFIEHEIELLARKNTSNGEKKLTKVQEENVGLKESIYQAMEDEKAYTISEMQKTFDFLKGLSNQRVSALVRQMKEDGKVIRLEEKGKAYFVKSQD